MADLSPEAMARVAMLLGQHRQPAPQQDSIFLPSRARGRAAFGLRPETPPANVAATPPMLPGYQIPGMPDTRPGPVAVPGMNPPVTPANAAPTVQQPPAPPANQPAAVAAAPPMSPTDGPQPLQPLPPPQVIGAGPGSNAQMSRSTSIWDDFRRMLASGQIPEGYRAAMGEMIKNT